LAKGYFDLFPRSVKKAILEWIASVKKPETRAARIRETVTKAEKDLRANASVERPRSKDRRAVRDSADSFGRRANVRQLDLRAHLLSVYASSLFQSLLE